MSQLVKVYGPWPQLSPVEIKPGLLRRLGIRNSPFATIGELAKSYPMRRRVRR